MLGVNKRIERWKEKNAERRIYDNILYTISGIYIYLKIYIYITPYLYPAYLWAAHSQCCSTLPKTIQVPLNYSALIFGNRS
tara:strand:+ start:520 stop:762 length:243 start_codon:yes stop_codon:yes gene_type:complete